MKCLIRVKIFLLLLVLIIPLKIIAHDVEEYDCFRNICKDCPKQLEFNFHKHIQVEIIPSKNKLDSLVDNYQRVVVFDNIKKLTVKDIEILLSSKIRSICFNNVSEFENEELKLLLEININNRFSNELDSINLLYDNANRQDSMLVHWSLRMAKQAFIEENTLILDGLTILTDRQAEIISQYRGIYLQLGGITDLPDNQIKILSHFQGAELCMANLNEEDKKKYREYRKQYVKYIKR